MIKLNDLAKSRWSIDKRNGRIVVEDGVKIATAHANPADPPSAWAKAKLISECPAMLACLLRLLPDWHDDADDESFHDGAIIGEITYGDVRAIREVLSRLS